MSQWEELGDGILRRRYRSLDLNVGLVVGDEHVLVIDSRAYHEQADETIRHVREVTPRPVTVLVNTHHHWDHTFGNARFVDAEVVAHRRCREAIIEDGEDVKQELVAAAWLSEDARSRIAQVELRAPTRVLTDQLALDLGGRTVTVSHLGRGHTDNDVVVSVDDVLFAGDLVEEGAPPAFGDSYPQEWVDTLGRLLAARPEAASGRAREVVPRSAGAGVPWVHAGVVVVPGHGDVVDRDFVAAQRETIGRAVAGEDVYDDQVMGQLRSRL